VHVDPLPVLDNLVQQDFLFPRRLDPTGDFRKSRPASREIASFTGDDLIDILGLDIPDRDRLQDAVSFHGSHQLGLGSLFQPLSGLRRIRPDARSFDEIGAAEPSSALNGA
jgi:hypothetical protein